MTLWLFLVGLGLLLIGAEGLVRGASRLATRFSIPPLVIGLTVVAFGTSAPELAVSVNAAWAGNANIALGNVVGSNIFNVLFILGLSALLTPLVVSKNLVRLDVPVMIGAALLVVVLGWNGVIGRMDGAILVLLGIVYTVFQIREGRRDHERDSDGDNADDSSPGHGHADWRQSVVLVVLGLGALVLGARWLVAGAVTLARAFGVNELVIGLTVIAAGTSLPEVATSVMASVRGERDIAVGNVIGSNIFNVFWVLGLASVVSNRGVEIPAVAWQLDFPVMVATSVVCLPILLTGYVVARWEGGFFLAYYLGYTTLLTVAAMQLIDTPIPTAVVVGFLAPMVGLTLITLILHLRRAHRGGAKSEP